MNRLKGIIYDCIVFLAGMGSRKKSAGKKALIVRVDEIGDFMLWHNFIKDITTAEKFSGYRFYFCGNQSTRSLFESFDASYVQGSWWMDKVRFKKDMKYRYRFLKNIYKEGFDTVINPTFSRDKRYDDSIVRAAHARERIGMVANLESMASYEEGYDKALYTALFDHPEKPLFEFYRNRLFTEFVTGEKTSTENTRLPGEKLPLLPMQLPVKYFVVFPGSRSKKTDLAR